MSPEERKQMWQQRIEAYKSSGYSLKAWCGQNQVGYQSMFKWKKIMESEEELNNIASPTQWVAIESSDSDFFEEPSSNLTVKIRNVSIEIKEGFNRTLFTEVLQILQTHVK